MEVSSNYLHLSDVKKNIELNRPFLWATNSNIPFLVLGGGVMGYTFAIAGCNLMNFFCEKIVSEAVNLDTISYAIGIISAIGTYGYLNYQDNKILEKEKLALNLFGKKDKIISKLEFESFLAKSRIVIDPDLDEQFEVPEESDLEKIRKSDQKYLENLLNQINQEKIDQNSIETDKKHVSMFNLAFEQVKEDPSMRIQLFLGSKLGLDNFDKISLFAKTNDLSCLKFYCEEFFIKNICNVR